MTGTEVELNGLRMVPGATLFAGDIIRLGADSQVALRSGNSSVLAAPLTEFIVESEGVSLRGGRVQVRTSGTESFVVAGPFFQVNMVASAGAPSMAEVRLEGARARVAAVSGMADLTAAGSATTYRLHGGEMASLKAAGGDAAAQIPAGPSAGRVSRLLPEVQIDRASQTLVAAALDPVLWNDNLRSGPAGRAHIALNDGSLLNLGSNTSLKILQHDAQAQQTSLDLTLGRLRGKVAKLTRPGSSFEVRTPVGVAGLVGTDFSLEVTGDYVELIVFEGAVRFTIFGNPQSILVVAGQKLRVQRSGVIVGPLPASPEEIQAAQNFTDIPATPSPPVPPGNRLPILVAVEVGTATVSIGLALTTQEHRHMSPITPR